ncbi:hypothetical protein JDV02_005569 [Purpureocillium takamizusanense]|uniref:Multicopper oxidase n=1 Tax=Purpureocillium takamizusanense TaxID=2060973 RepID=A0A9Q8VBZ6_9HYPO|nr:uncharacterized protein JDV02_005569 [Purpureocillium takamizusanense]UNI19384.1 hypothetical protein JDV02_005569 [Purpureocillium takamizusanense]
MTLHINVPPDVPNQPALRHFPYTCGPRIYQGQGLRSADVLSYFAPNETLRSCPIASLSRTGARSGLDDLVSSLLLATCGARFALRVKLMESAVDGREKFVRRSRHEWFAWLCLWLTIPIICFGLYTTIVQNKWGVSLPQSSRLPDGGHNSDTALPQSHHEPGGDLHVNDPSVLHPDHHIFRQPRSIRLRWNITKQGRRPDGVLKDVYLINGQFPGPTIEARSGDQIEVTITNNIDTDTGEGLAIHWHGMFMKEANEMDGVVGVTQCSIPPAASFTYTFRVHPDQHGTFWYHAHSAVQRADGLYGGFVVHKPVDQDGQNDPSLYQYDSEKLLLIGDWYHASADAVLAEYKDFRNFAYEPAPDSLLINGHGSYNCSDARPGAPVDCVEVPVPVVRVPGKRATRLRVINTGSSTGYSLQLKKATFQLITVDGGGRVSDETPQTPTIGVVYPGQRADLLLVPDDRSTRDTDATISVILDQELMPLWNPALTSKQSFSLAWSDSLDTTFRRKTNGMRIVNIYDLADIQAPHVPTAYTLRNAPDEIALLYTSLAINSFKDDEPWGELNHTSWVWENPKAKPLLAMNKADWENGTVQANPMRSFHVPWFEADNERWLELIVNNVDDKGHPFHLHGYDFYVVASRQPSARGKTYNPFDEAHQAYKDRNLDTPVKRDTVYIKPQGHVVLRFQLHNAGLWLLHCHVLWHQAVGMGMVIQIGNVTQETAKKAGESCK